MKQKFASNIPTINQSRISNKTTSPRCHASSASLHPSTIITPNGGQPTSQLKPITDFNNDRWVT